MNHVTNLKRLFLLALTLVLLGCTTQPFISQAQIKQQSVNNQLKGAIDYIKECEDANASNPDVINTYEQITVKGLNPANRSVLLTTNKKLNAEQKAAFQSYLKMDEACFNGVMVRLEGSPYATLFQGADALSAVNDASLLNGTITIADANAKKIEIVQRFLSDLTTLQQQLTAEFQQAHNTEVVIRSNNQAVSSVAAQNAINSMNTATQIRQSQTTQQLLQQNQYRVPAPCLGFNCR
jgi:hypothetical protein